MTSALYQGGGQHRQLREPQRVNAVAVVAAVDAAVAVRKQLITVAVADELEGQDGKQHC